MLTPRLFWSEARLPLMVAVASSNSIRQVRRLGYADGSSRKDETDKGQSYTGVDQADGEAPSKMQAFGRPVDERTDDESQQPGQEADDDDPAEGADERQESVEDEQDEHDRPGHEEDRPQSAGDCWPDAG